MSSNEQKIQPWLIIGLGGFGGNVVGRMKRILRHHYELAQPAALSTLSYLVIDTDRFDRLSPVVQQELDGEDEYQQITGYTGCKPSQLYHSARDKERADLDSWFPPKLVNRLPSDFVDNGASRLRALGRLFLYFKRMDVQHALLALPEVFIKAAAANSPGLPPYMRANSFAFFRELDFVLKHPARFNDLAMDRVSSDRRSRERGGTGLPEGTNDVLRLAYLAGEEIEGLGTHAVDDMIAFSATAMAHRVLSNGLESYKSNVEDYFSQTDTVNQRPKRYAALGYSEVRFPADVLREYLYARFRYDALRLGLLGAVSGDNEKVVVELGDRITNLAKALCGELDGALEAAVARRQRYIGATDDHKSGDEVDVRAVDAGTIRHARTRAEGSLQQLKQELGLEYQTRAKALVDRFRAEVTQIADGLADGHGMAVMRRALERADDVLEEYLVETLSGADGQTSNDAAAHKAEAALFGSAEETSPPIEQRLAQAKDRMFGAAAKVENVLDELYGQLGTYLRKKGVAQSRHLRGELLKHMCGAHQDIEAHVSEYDDRGAVIGSRPVRSVIDELEDRLRVASAVIDGWPQQTKPSKALADRFNAEGRALTCHAIPDVSSIDKVHEHVAIEEWVARLMPGLAEHASTDARRRDVEEIVQGLAEARPAVSMTALGDTIDENAAREAFDAVTQRICDARIDQLERDGSWSGLKLGTKVWDLVQAADNRDAILENLVRDSSHGCIVRKTDLSSQDQSEVMDLRILLASHAELRDQIPGGATHLKAFWPSSADRIAVFRHFAGLPIWVFPEFTNQAQTYYRRDLERNICHVDQYFEDGRHEADDPFDDSRQPREVFLCARALTVFLLGRESWRDELGATVDWDTRSYDRSPPRLVWFEDGAGWQAQELDVSDRGGIKVAAPKGKATTFLNKTFEDLQRSNKTSQHIVDQYARERAIVASHQALVDAIEGSKKSAGAALAAYSSYADQLRRRERQFADRWELEQMACREWIDALESCIGRLRARYPTRDGGDDVGV